MRWTTLRSLARAQSIPWAFGLWIPASVGVLIARAGSLVATYPVLARIDYPRVVMCALLFAMAGTAWAVFAALCEIIPDSAIREHKSQTEYLEKRNKAYSGDEWPAIFTLIVEKWERDNRLSPVATLTVAILPVVAFILTVFAAYELGTAIFPLLTVPARH